MLTFWRGFEGRRGAVKGFIWEMVVSTAFWESCGQLAFSVRFEGVGMSIFFACGELK